MKNNKQRNLSINTTNIFLTFCAWMDILHPCTKLGISQWKLGISQFTKKFCFLPKKFHEFAFSLYYPFPVRPAFDPEQGHFYIVPAQRKQINLSKVLEPALLTTSIMRLPVNWDRPVISTKRIPWKLSYLRHISFTFVRCIK